MTQTDLSAVERSLERWRAELLDLSKANRLLYFKPGRGNLNLTHPDPSALFDGLANHGRSYTFCLPDDQPDISADEQLSLFLAGDAFEGDEDGLYSAGSLPRSLRPDQVVTMGERKKIESTLYRLRLRSRSVLLEQGVNVLFVAFGLLEWFESAHSDGRVISPLVLVPVQLERRSTLDPYKLTPLDDNAVLNPALALKFETDFGLKLALPTAGEEADLQLDDHLTHLRGLIATQPHWTVRSEAHLGLFSFAKHAMYADLATNKDRFAAHPIVRVLGGEDEDLPDCTMPLPASRSLDELVKPHEVFQVLDADASQQEAIARVRAGASVVIKGPPGTGKSQTITNIIAECLAQEKTVLFVSEKMAALRVVAERLKQAGLSEFCLEAHGAGTKKETVVKALADTLQGEQAPHIDTALVRLERLANVRHDLNEYVRALHAPTPLGLSVFQVHREVAARIDAPVLVFALPGIHGLTVARLEELTAHVQRLTALGHVLLAKSEHPWFGCILEEYSPETQALLDEEFHQTALAAEGLRDIQVRLHQALGLPLLSRIESAEWLSRLLFLLEKQTRVPCEWLALPSLDPLVAVANDWRARTQDYRARRANLLQHYRPEFFALDLSTLLQQLESAGAPDVERVQGPGDPADRALARRGELRAALAETITTLGALRTAGAVATTVGMPIPRTLAMARRTLKVCELALTDPRPQADWFRAERRVALEELAAEAGARQNSVTTGREKVRARFKDEFFTKNIAAMTQRFEEPYQVWWRGLRLGYRRDMKQLRRLVRDGSDAGTLSYEQALDYLKLARQVQGDQAWLDEHQIQLAAGFGIHYAGPRTVWSSISAALATVHGLCEVWGGREPPTPLIELLTSSPDGLESLRPYSTALAGAVSRAEGILDQIVRLVRFDGLPFGGFSPEDMPLSELATWLAGWSERLSSFWSAADTLDAQRTRALSSVAVAVGDVREAMSLRAFEQEVERSAADLATQFGRLYCGLDTDWDAVLLALQSTAELVAHFPEAPPTGFIEAIASEYPVSTSDKELLDSAIMRLVERLDALSKVLGVEFCGGAARFRTSDLGDVADWSRRMRGALPQLEEWVAFRRIVFECEAQGLAGFLAAVERDRPRPDAWVDAFVRQTYTTWLSWRYQQVPTLKRFRGEQHQHLIDEFRQLDQTQWKLASRRIAQMLVPKRPRLAGGGASRSEPAKLMREAGRRRFRPLRQLFADIPHLLPALKPCLLMSPLSVAQYLGESAVTFDVVIFDEASQIVPADAIGAIGRGRQLVVVGDEKQLPPTRFFTVNAQISDDAIDDDEPPESILDACLAKGLPPMPLRWHYRSRHEHLIAFSNRAFYEGRLITFPSPDESARALEFILVEGGMYDRGSSKVNRVESRRLADLVVDHVLHHPDQSLGVITFSESQMVAVQTELDARKRARPELEALLREDGPQGFFVKNLENVQGDERDVIFFSVGYGPDQTGAMSLNFGPLNKQGGERRLNVAITRARESVKILASFQPHRIDIARTQSLGVRLLRGYLEFAQQGPAALLGQITSEGGEPESTFEELVASALAAQGLHVVTQVGVGQYRIDLAIKDEETGRYLLGIECDGAMYHSAQTARDRDRLRQQVLERLGWRIHRIWSTDWIRNAQRETEKVLAALQRARADIAAGQLDNGSEPEQHETDDDLSPEQESVMRSPSQPISAPVPQAPIAQPYRSVALGHQGDRECFEQVPLSNLADLMRRCVEVEGPVHEKRVLSAVAGSFGIKRVKKLVRARLKRAMPLLSGVRRTGDFLWPENMQAAPVRALNEEGKPRPIAEVPWQEIEACVIAYLDVHFAIDHEGLTTGVAHTMGYRRTGSLVAPVISEVIHGMLRKGLLVDSGGQLRRG